MEKGLEQSKNRRQRQGRAVVQFRDVFLVGQPKAAESVLWSRGEGKCGWWE